MHGPRVKHVQDVFHCFNLESLWADRRPFVDYILGAEPGGGVFVIGHCDHPYQRSMLSYYKMGPGPFYLFYRPYHLCHMEAMGTVLKAVRQKKALLVPEYGLRTNVYAYAKRDLHTGEVLDGIGGYCCYGQIENTEQEHTAPGLPIALAHEVTLRRNIAKHQRILLDDVAYDPARLDFTRFHQACDIPPSYDSMKKLALHGRPQSVWRTP
jgi:predicted homoserine dehydrogenase-like protein